jgi:AMIN domain-containing protein
VVPARAQLCLLLAALAAYATAQSDHGATHRAEIRSVAVVPGENGPALEIVATRAVTPQLQTVQDPLRLVIDLPNSVLATPRKRIPFRNAQIKGVRLSQYQDNPPTARIVVDLAGPVQYTWDAMGNQLHVRMHADEAATAKPPSVPAFTTGVQPVAVPVAIGNSGTLVETGSRVAAGSSITAGEETAILRLNRGGEVRVCPGTTVSVSTSASGKDLLLGLSQGAMETHYVLQDSVDSVLTPDFRVVLPGPGQFNLAIGADSKGNTCVASLPGSTSSAVVAELLGNGTYEIKPDQQVLFRQGHLNSVENPAFFCGCPAPREPVMTASVNPAEVAPEPKPGEKMRLAKEDDPSGVSPAASLSPVPANGDAPQPKGQPGTTEIDTGLVFSGRERAKARAATPTPPSPPLAEVAELPFIAKQQRDPLPPTVVIAPPDPKPVKKGFLGKMRGFFGAIFR